MKTARLLTCVSVPLVACSLATLGGCSSPAEPVEHQPTVLKKAINKADALAVTSNIQQINQMLYSIKNDNEGKAPATLEAAKAAVKVPAEMWIDTVTEKPLKYDPASGTVYRDGANPNTPPTAGSSPGNMNLPTGSGGY